MKTKEECLRNNFGSFYTGLPAFALKSTLDSMDEYASQFQQEWIPVEVRLPEITMRTSSDWVLTFDKSISRIDKAFYSTVTGWQAEHGEPMNVSHWMPLPTPPLPQPYNPKQP